MKRKRRNRINKEGQALIGHQLWIPKPDVERANKISKRSKPHMSKHAVLCAMISLGLDVTEAHKGARK